MLLDLFRHYLEPAAPAEPQTGQARPGRVGVRVLSTSRRVLVGALEAIAELSAAVRTRRRIPVQLEADAAIAAGLHFRPVPLARYVFRSSFAVAGLELSARTVHVRRDLVLGRRNMRTLFRLGEL